MRLLLLLCSAISLLTYAQSPVKKQSHVQGAIVRGDSTKKELALVFTADETGEGLTIIRHSLTREGVKAGFFFTGRFYRNASFTKEIRLLKKDGHYLGPHSDQHLLYCDWNKRDSLLVTKDSFEKDVRQNIAAIRANNLALQSHHLFIPPFEWWNDSISAWSKSAGFTLFNFTPGIRTNADYTWPEMGTTYKSSEWVMAWLKETISREPTKLNGAIVLLHAGTDPRRKDKFYNRLKEMIALLKRNGFLFKRIDELLKR